jgi:starch synthase
LTGSASVTGRAIGVHTVPATTRSILLVTPEAAPFAKSGGLADAAGALALALGRLGHQVRLVLPRYRGVAAGRPVGRAIVAIGADRLTAVFSEHEIAAGVRAVLVECPELFDREHLYGSSGEDYADNARRFAFLSRASLEVAVVSGERPDVIHAHDWQTGLIPVYLKTLYSTHRLLAGAAVVFTIHNLAYQGLFASGWLEALDLPREWFTVDRLEYWGHVSFLKAGINASDMITTVSPAYAREIQTPEYGCGFEGIVGARTAKLVGILNGIDTDRWNPQTDALLPVAYDRSTLSRKREIRKTLIETMGLAADADTMSRPLVGMVSRMVDQKGFDLLATSVAGLLERPIALAVLGSGDPGHEQLWRDLARTHPDRVGVRIGFDDPLAHLIIAGADLLLMPSRFEPCGLSQMYALRYGTVPVVRAVGGLGDTVIDWDPTSGQGTGFTFTDYTSDALFNALDRARALFGEPTAWQALQAAGMQVDHSWRHSAGEYVNVYERAIRLARPKAGHKRRIPAESR